MYEIEEPNDAFSLLTSVSISLFFLNRAAKYSFTSRMGVHAVSYGNVFLFRNGFRILPYGEWNDDSWGLNQRQQQGYKRFLGTRDLFGRVDVETDNPELIKEVSSRDGGLIKTEASQQLMNYFTLIHRRLQRYVVGVLWGEGFVRRDYFINQKSALKAREQLKEIDKDSDSAQHLFTNIGSKVDFLQLIKTLVNDKSIKVLRYNEDLADIVSNPTETEMIQAQMLDDIRKLAEKTNDPILLDKIQAFDKHVDELRRQKEEAERKADEERQKAEIAKKKAAEEEEKRAKAERERDAQIQKNKYLTATRNTTKEVQDIIHAISINSTELISLISNLSGSVRHGDFSREGVMGKLREASFYISKIKQLSMLITKADIVSLMNKQRVDLIEYISEYVSHFKNSLHIIVETNNLPTVWRMISLLDVAIVLDNLISNSKKNGAKSIGLFFSKEGNSLLLDFSDDGDGVDLNLFTPDSIFDEGITNKAGGSGIGLSTIRFTMETRLNGSVSFVGNNCHGMKGATFRLFFK